MMNLESRNKLKQKNQQNKIKTKLKIITNKKLSPRGSERNKRGIYEGTYEFVKILPVFHKHSIYALKEICSWQNR